MIVELEEVNAALLSLSRDVNICADHTAAFLNYFAKGSLVPQFWPFEPLQTASSVGDK